MKFSSSFCLVNRSFSSLFVHFFGSVALSIMLIMLEWLFFGYCFEKEVIFIVECRIDLRERKLNLARGS